MFKCMNLKFVCSAISTVRRDFSSQTRRVKINKIAGSSNSNPRSSKIPWTDEQSRVLSDISNGKSGFITGSAGSGKTVLLKQAVQNLKKLHGSSQVFVTASTGVAACALNGQTLHSFAGVGLGLGNKEDLLSRIFSNKKALNRWKKVTALVIDEISMIPAGLFESLEHIARATRNKDAVWGDIQLVVSGDFLQLPPIPNEYNSTSKLYAFEADCWDSSFDFQVELTHIFRQVDGKLIKLLQGIRRGEIDHNDLLLLKQCSCSADKNPVDPSTIQLYPRIEDVKRVNNERMEVLKKEKAETVTIFDAYDSGKEPWKRQLKLGIAPDSIELCEGARVMLIKNLKTKEKLVNGATGTIKGFDAAPGDKILRRINSDNLLPIVKFDSGTTMIISPESWEVTEGDIVYAERTQIPLILAWALSIHKCQGMTLDKLHTDLSRAFGCGMVYVALSRLKSLDGLHMSGFNARKIKADPKVLQYYQRFVSKQEKMEE